MTAPETMIGRCARAAYTAEFGDTIQAVLSWTEDSLAGKELRKDWADVARAVLLALREPSEGMIAAYGDIPFGSKGTWQEDGRTIFQANIDAALAETP